MSDDLRATIRGALDRIDAHTDRRVRSADRTNVLARLNGADLLSMVALFLAWTSALAFIRGEPNWAIVLMFAAFGFDKLDGFYARRRGLSSAFGRQIDSFIDVFAYLVTAALLFHYAIAPNVVVSAVVGFAVIAFGGLRLVRHNSEGFGEDEGKSFYHGTTVVHTNLVVVVNYLAVAFVGLWNGWIAAVTVLVAAPLMVSDYKAYKTRTSHLLGGATVALVTALVMLLEFGYL
jgi:CDP-diacylglycerol--serine O-phosphatidyltransferase